MTPSHTVAPSVISAIAITSQRTAVGGPDGALRLGSAGTVRA
jgi:hypothetical protein